MCYLKCANQFLSRETLFLHYKVCQLRSTIVGHRGDIKKPSLALELELSFVGGGRV